MTINSFAFKQDILENDADHFVVVCIENELLI